MKPKPFKFRYVNRIAGVFLFVAFVILAVLVALAGKSQQWFAEVTRYRVELPAGSGGEEGPAGTLGIRPGSDVRVIGTQVGQVDRVELCAGKDLVPIESFDEVDPEDIRIVAVLSVKGDFSHFVGPDSRAVLKFDLGGLGSSYFDITRGTRRFASYEIDAQGSRWLPFGREKDAKAEVFDVVSRIESELIPAIRRTEETATEARDFFANMNDENKSLQRSLNTLETGLTDLNRFIAQAAAGEGALGDMIKSDSQMRKEFNEFAVSLNRGTQNLERSVNNLGEGITELREGGIASFNRGAGQFPATVQNTNAAIDQIDTAARQFQETVREFEVLVEGLQQHWLVKKNIHDPLEDAPQRPATAAKPRGESDEADKPGLFKRVFGKGGEKAEE